MYNLIEYSSNYSETTGSLWFYSKDEATNVNAVIANNNNFKSFEYIAELLGNTVAPPNPNHANGVLSAAGNENVNNNDSDYIIFTIKDTKLHVPVVTCGFER